MYCGQTVGWINIKLGMQVGLSPGHIVLDGDPALPPPKGAGQSPPQFSAHIYCGQMAGWIKMPLGREAGLCPSDIVLDGDPAPLPQKGVEPPIFSPCLLWPDGWMDQDATWHGGRSQPRPHCARWVPDSQLPYPKWGRPHNFRPIFVVFKWLDASRCHLVGR